MKNLTQRYKKITGVIFIVLGILALITPLTPGSWLIFVGLELIGIRLVFYKNLQKTIMKLVTKLNIQKKTMINIQKNIILAPYTTFRIGGPAKEFVEVTSERELIEAVDYAEKNNLKIFILGGGSNLLISDNGFDGLVIKIKLNNLEIDNEKNTIIAGAGVSIAKLIKYATEHSLTGLEWSAGLPGGLGGAIRGNAGTFGLSMYDVVVSVRIYNLENKKIEEFEKNKCELVYRNSIFKKNENLIILSAILKLEKGEKDAIQQKVLENINWRKNTFPENSSPGSFFRHTEPTEHNLKKLQELPRFYELKMHEKNTIPTGFVIEEAGLKGKKIGGAMVSQKHANFILNTGDATAEDVVMLASFIKQQVRDQFGVELQEEIRYVGF
jgi:UDP-N-acetylmuramate dehydrogenase